MSSLNMLARRMEDFVKYGEAVKKKKDGRAQKGYVTSASRYSDDYVSINGKSYPAEAAIDMELFEGLPVYVQVTPGGKAVVVGSA